MHLMEAQCYVSFLFMWSCNTVNNIMQIYTIHFHLHPPYQQICFVMGHMIVTSLLLRNYYERSRFYKKFSLECTSTFKIGHTDNIYDYLQIIFIHFPAFLEQSFTYQPYRITFSSQFVNCEFHNFLIL